MIFLTVNISGYTGALNERGAPVMEEIEVFSVPLDLLEPEQCKDLILNAIRTALLGIREESHERINVTFAFERLPSAGVFVLHFPRELPNGENH